MKAGKELNLLVSQAILGFSVVKKRNGPYVESTPKGSRPLRNYSTEIEAAWEVAEKIGVTLIPIENGYWFAFVGEGHRWQSPAQFIQYLSNENFQDAGAAVAETAPLVICLAALRALENRQAKVSLSGIPTEPTSH